MYYMYPYVLMEATGYMSPKTGQEVEMTANDKNVYVVMKKRNTFFKDHFDKQEDIAKLTGISVKQAGRILRKFIEEGVVQTVLKKGGGSQFKNYRYTGVVDLHLYQEEIVNEEKVSKLLEMIPDFIWTSDKQEKVDKPPKTFVNSKPKYEPKPNPQDWDESDLPF